jgi:hypothetical protein
LVKDSEILLPCEDKVLVLNQPVVEAIPKVFHMGPLRKKTGDYVYDVSVTQEIAERTVA